MNPLTIDCPQTGVWRAEIVNQWLPVDSFIGPWEVGLWETIINKLSRNRVFLKGEKWSGPAHALAPCTSTVVFFLLIARLLLLLHTLIWMGGHFHVSPKSLKMWWKRRRRNNENVPRDETPKDVYRKTGWEKKNVLIRNLLNFLLHPPSIFPFTLSLAL